MSAQILVVGIFKIDETYFLDNHPHTLEVRINIPQGFYHKLAENMSKLLAIFGATGQQGSSVINYVLNDLELSQQYKIRAITRDVDSEKAKQLKTKVEVVQGDVLDRTTLESALSGVHTIFAMTTPSYGPDALEIEYNSGKAIADVAVEKGAEYIIFSTLPSIREMSGEKYTKVHPFDAKAKIEQYIRDLPIKSAFYSAGFFMENFPSALLGSATGSRWRLGSSPAQLPRDPNALHRRRRGHG